MLGELTAIGIEAGALGNALTGFGGGLNMVAAELALFAAIGMLIFSLDDLLVDLLWFAGYGRANPHPFVAPPQCSGTDSEGEEPVYAVLIPAWQEASVLETTVTRILALWGRGDVRYRLYIGCYPNDPLTLFAASRLAAMDDRMRIAIHSHPGHSTKADCLNMIWDQIAADESNGAPPVAGIILQDAEDIIHAQGLAAMVAAAVQHDLVQLPVRPIIEADQRWIAGHYADEFAESHGKDLRVRQALGAVVPAAGVGFLLRRAMINALIAAHGHIFARDSLTEDYELAYRVHALDGRSYFSVQQDQRGDVIATSCAYPDSLWPAVRQKARWTNGIAISGWDRVGWPEKASLASYWMLWRDRRVTLNAILIAAAYGAIFLGTFGFMLQSLGSDAAAATFLADLAPATQVLLLVNAGLLGWRLIMRGWFTAKIYGWKEGFCGAFRSFISNFIMILAVRRAVTQHWLDQTRELPYWDKTTHVQPLFVVRPQRSARS
jgi:bacteriophage N4 adsorption protein B